MQSISWYLQARRARFAGLVMALLAGGCTAQLGRQQTRDTHASLDMAACRQSAPDIDHPLTLQEALDCAARYNIEAWIAAREREFQHELLTHSRLQMLPSLNARGQSSRRSEYDASSSVSLASETESLEPSYSSEKSVRTWDISATWNLLDFGISFLRARQQANREAIALERERRVRQNLALEVSRAYWNAITARQSALAAAAAASEVAAVREKLAKEIEEKAISEVEGLKRETRLLEQQEELQRYRRRYLRAKAELASLIGLPPDAGFTLAPVDLDETPAVEQYDVQALEWEALRGRPELFEKDFEGWISRDEARIALARIFPGVSLFWRYDQDYNRFLAFNHWHTAGLRVSWDLLTIPQQLQQHKAINLQTELLSKRRTAVAVAILTQLHLALIECDQTLEQYQLATTIADKHRELTTALEKAAKEGKSHDGEAIEYRMRYLKARGRQLVAYADMMTARARLTNTLGHDRLAESFANDSKTATAQDNQNQNNSDREIASQIGGV